jgi:hypothetical protein
MTDCDNIDVREMLPDFVAGRATAHEAERVKTHVEHCALCAAELALIRSVRSVRPVAAPVDISRIVGALPKAPRAAIAVSPFRTRSRVWQLAAAIGVIMVGGGSLLVARNGGFVSVATLAVDSADTRGEIALGNSNGSSGIDSAPSHPAAPAVVPEMAVSFGNVGDYSDEELDRILDRLDRWDGATSTESITTQPIVPVNQGGSGQ